MKHIIRIVCVCLFVICLGGCGKKPSTDVGVTPAAVEEVKNEPASGFSREEIVVYPTVYPTSRSITWTNVFIPEENRNEINRILYEKGLDCQIRFVKAGDHFGTEYAQWLDYCEETIPLDIISSSSWSQGESEVYDFLNTRMFPLNDLLETEEGKTLKEAYTANEWRECTRNRKVYTVPVAVRGSFYTGYTIDTGLHISVKEDYLDFFTEYDGTYTFLKEIYKRIGNNDLCIVINQIDETMLYGLLGYKALHYAAIPYSEELRSVPDITETDELPSLLKNLYDDLNSGLLINPSVASEIPDNVLVFLEGNATTERTGFRDLVIQDGTYEFNCNMKFGINRTSTQKELAFQILSVCFSDPDILCLIYPGVDRNLIDERMKKLSAIPEADTAGMILPETERILSSIMAEDTQYDMHFLRLVNSMYVYRNPEDYSTRILNPDWDVTKAWKEYTESVPYFGEIREAANQDIKTWFSGEKGEGK